MTEKTRAQAQSSFFCRALSWLLSSRTSKQAPLSGGGKRGKAHTEAQSCSSIGRQFKAAVVPKSLPGLVFECEALLKNEQAVGGLKRERGSRGARGHVSAGCSSRASRVRSSLLARQRCNVPVPSRKSSAGIPTLPARHTLSVSL
ncbi:hypothetical protein NQZ68_026606 [Dissostichus eleginoides]|nr:hypothetical protein NQZ68_026606 [Dissostichus eleginoides]